MEHKVESWELDQYDDVCSIWEAHWHIYSDCPFFSCYNCGGKHFSN